MGLRKPAGRTPDQVELDRIMGLPIWDWPDPETVEIESFERVLAPAYDAGDRLFPAQVAGIRAYESVRGGIFPIPLGFGKTGLCLLIAQAAQASGIRRILWLLPPRLIQGLIKRHVPEWRKRIPLSLNFHHLSGRAIPLRARIAQSGAPGVYLLPYSLLSSRDSVDLLNWIEPELVLADEVHELKNPRSGRTNRIMHYLRNSQPEFVGMSGTITSKSISDYHHLTTAALHESSPLPISSSMAFRWGRVLDASAGAMPQPHERAVVYPLVRWAKDNFPDDAAEFDNTTAGYRRAYKRRFTTAPGIVSPGSDMPGISLLFNNYVPTDEPGPPLLKLIEGVEKRGITPSGEVIDHAIHAYQPLYELNNGFYNKLTWPEPHNVAKANEIPEAEAESRIERAREHHEAQQAYRRELRQWFADSPPPGLDTPREVGTAIHRHGDAMVPTMLAELWREMKDLEFPHMPKRKSEAVRVDDFKIQAAADWAEAKGKGVIWVFNPEIGKWLCEVLLERGVDVIHAPARADSEIEAVGDPTQGGQGDRIVVASKAHATGKNLQAFQNQLFLQWFRSPVLVEQAIGRLHREGQQADNLIVDTMLATGFDHEQRAATLVDAIYISQSNMSQRILVGDYDPLPTLYPPEFLKERGFSPKKLNQEQRKRLSTLAESVV